MQVSSGQSKACTRYSEQLVTFCHWLCQQNRWDRLWPEVGHCINQPSTLVSFRRSSGLFSSSVLVYFWLNLRKVKCCYVQVKLRVFIPFTRCSTITPRVHQFTYDVLRRLTLVKIWIQEKFPSHLISYLRRILERICKSNF